MRNATQQGDRTDAQPQELALELVPRRAVLVERGDRRRRQHHEQPEQVEDDDDREQPRVSDRADDGRRWCLGRRHPAGTGPTVASAARGRPAWSRHRSGGRFRRTASANDLAPLGVGTEPVERGTRRREKDDIARSGHRRRGLDHVGHPGAAPPAPRRRSSEHRRPPSSAASPIATTARTGGTVPARTSRSSPLLRPPAISTTESNPATAATVAWAVVAFESSNQRTPPTLGHQLDAMGAGRGRAQHVRTASTSAPAATAETDAARALAMSWGSDRGSSSTGQEIESVGRTRRPPSTVASGPHRRIRR